MPMISGGTPTTAAAAQARERLRGPTYAPRAEPTSAATAASVSAELLPPVCTPPG